MAENYEHRLVIQLNAVIHTIRSGEISFRPNVRMSTVYRPVAGHAINILADGTGQITLTSAQAAVYSVSISVLDEGSLLVGNIRVNGRAGEIRFNDNWTLDQTGLTNHRLNRNIERVPLTRSNVLHIECAVNAFNLVGDENFIIVRSSNVFGSAPVAIHLTKNGLLDVLWHQNETIPAHSEYFHDLYYALFNDGR